MIVGLLGILRAGGAYLPLDPVLPAERLRLLAADAAAAAILAPRRLAAAGVGFAAPVIWLDDDRTEPAGPDGAAEPLPEAAARNLAYVLYTSGSTGRPKGVLVDRAALSRFTANAAAAFGIESRDRVLQFASLSFDASCEEIYPALVAGATLVLRDDAMLSSASRFLATCGDWGITVLDLPTAFWHMLVAEMEHGRISLPAALRLLIIGGERAQPERVRAWFDAAGARPRLCNSYGPTEATVTTTAGALDRPLAAAVALGRPLPGCGVRLLDRELEQVPIGVAGELHIAGSALARGYLGRSDLTGERFIPDPFGGPGSRLYRTGDLVRHLPDGTFDFVGRIDGQVKIRGFRVEPDEIAAALAGYPGIVDAAVIAVDAGAGNPRLVAYLATTAPGPAAAEVRDRLARQLPAYMVPVDYVMLASLPRSATGKLDRKALPLPNRHSDLGPAPPGNRTEALLAGIWRELLAREQVGIYDDLFDLGAHSLLAPQFTSRVQDIFALELPLHVLFESPTVAQLAVAIQEALLARIESLSEEEAAALAGWEEVSG